MMNFRVVNAALINILGSATAGAFRVIGYRGQGHDSEEVRNLKRMVQVYCAFGDFPKSAGRQTGPAQHVLTFNIDFSVSSAARVNLAAINAPGATSLQIATALAGLQEASYEADVLLDELIDLTYQIVMDGRNFDLGMDKGVMSSRWVTRIQKDEPQPVGDLVTLTGRMVYTCQTVEEVAGDTGIVMGLRAVGTSIDIIGDDVEQTIVETRG